MTEIGDNNKRMDEILFHASMPRRQPPLPFLPTEDTLHGHSRSVTIWTILV